MHHRLLFVQNFLKKFIFAAASAVRCRRRQRCPGRLVWYLEVEIKIIYDRFVSVQELDARTQSSDRRADHWPLTTDHRPPTTDQWPPANGDRCPCVPVFDVRGLVAFGHLRTNCRRPFRPLDAPRATPSLPLVAALDFVVFHAHQKHWAFEQRQLLNLSRDGKVRMLAIKKYFWIN